MAKRALHPDDDTEALEFMEMLERQHAENPSEYTQGKKDGARLMYGVLAGYSNTKRDMDALIYSSPSNLGRACNVV